MAKFVQCREQMQFREDGFDFGREWVYLISWVYLIGFIHVIHQMCRNYLIDLITHISGPSPEHDTALGALALFGVIFLNSHFGVWVLGFKALLD